MVPDFMERMIERGWLGEKRGQGFYKRVGKGAEKEIHAIDRKTLEYHPAQKVKFPSAEAVPVIEDLPQRLRALVAGTDRVGPVPLEPLPRFFALFGARWFRRFPTASSRSTAPCAGDSPSSSGRSKCGTRWASARPLSA